MLRRLWLAIRPAVFWTYRRGSWQYDVIVALILAFIFLTPRSWFRDQPRPQQVVLLHAEGGQEVYMVDSDAIGPTPPENLAAHLRGLVDKRKGKGVTLLKTEPVHDSEGNLKGYLVYAKP